jgi:hypothetical protein
MLLVQRAKGLLQVLGSEERKSESYREDELVISDLRSRKQQRNALAVLS